MNKRFTSLILALGLVPGGLVSCSTVKTSMKKVSKPIKNLSTLNSNDWKMFKLRDLRTDSPPIVKVRPGDLKKMKTGEEKILAWNRSRRASTLAATSTGGVFSMPEDFDPSSLPSGDLGGDFGILPSLHPDGSPDAGAGEVQGTPSGDLPSND